MSETFKVTTKNPERWKESHYPSTETTSPSVGETVDDLVTRYTPQDADPDEIPGLRDGKMRDLGVIGSGHDLSTPDGRQDYVDELLEYGVDVAGYSPDELLDLQRETMQYREDRRASDQANAATERITQDYIDKGEGSVKMGASSVADLTSGKDFRTPKGQFMSSEQIALVATHEDQIRKGEVDFLRDLLDKAPIETLVENAKKRNMSPVDYIVWLKDRLTILEPPRPARTRTRPIVVPGPSAKGYERKTTNRVLEGLFGKLALQVASRPPGQPQTRTGSTGPGRPAATNSSSSSTPASAGKPQTP